jgi:hypothetical protein
VIGDAVTSGVVASLRHPGGNITGSSFFNPELMAKRLELLKEIAPSMTQAAVLLTPGLPGNGPVLRAMEMTAKVLKVGLQPFEARGPSEYESTFIAIADKKIGEIVVHDNPIFVRDAKLLAAIVTRQADICTSKKDADIVPPARRRNCFSIEENGLFDLGCHSEGMAYLFKPIRRFCASISIFGGYASCDCECVAWSRG